MKLKNNKTLPVIVTSRTEAETLMHDVAVKTNEKRTLMARLDAAMLKLQEDVAPEISACDEAIAAKCEALRAWAESNPEEFPRGRKSILLLNGTVGFRMGTPRLALFSRAFDWDGVLDRLRQKGWNAFIRTRSEPDKDSLLAQRERYNLQEVGLKVVQEEAFYVEPRLMAGVEKGE